MSNQMLVYSSIAVVIGIFLLFFVNLITRENLPNTYLEPNSVRGMAITHNGKPYTLNFQQQLSTIKYLNLSQPVTKTDYYNPKASFPFSDLTIYLFNKPEIIITPVAMRDKNLVYSSPNWNPQGYLLELSGGELMDLIYNSYDP